MVTPILAHNFYSFAALANIANAIAVPISMLVIPLGMLALITGATLLPITVVLCGIARVLMQAMLLSNKLCLALPFAYVDNIYFSGLAMAGWYVAVGGVVLVLVKPELRRHLAVGDGQCAVIESPDGPVIVVDAGSRQYPSLQGALLADRVILPFLSRRGIRRLDALVITHPQSDHCNAVPRLLQRMPVGVILEPGFNPDTKVWQAVEDAAKEYQVPVKTVRAGGCLNLGKRAEAVVLAPSYPLIAGSRDDLNNNSVVLRLEYGQVSLLMLADQEKAGLARLITWSRQHGVSLRSTIMQVPHHGRNLEQAVPIMQLSQPQLGIISAEHELGREAYPLTAGTAEFIQTGDVGMITVETNGEDVRVCGFLSGCREAGFF
jgi:competence protein ComEC